MNQDWQSFAAFGVVLGTLTLFVIRALKSRKRAGCGGGCGCAPKIKSKAKTHS